MMGCYLDCMMDSTGIEEGFDDGLELGLHDRAFMISNHLTHATLHTLCIRDDRSARAVIHCL